jgi:hypothetical protein
LGILILYGQNVHPSILLLGIACLVSTFLNVNRTRRYDVGLGLALLVSVVCFGLVGQLKWQWQSVWQFGIVASLIVSLGGYALVRALLATKPLDWMGIRVRSLSLSTNQGGLASDSRRISRLQAFVLPISDLALLVSVIGLGMTFLTCIEAALLIHPITIATWEYAVAGWLLLMAIVINSRSALIAFALLLPLMISTALQFHGLAPRTYAASALIWATTVLFVGVLPCIVKRHRDASEGVAPSDGEWFVLNLSRVSSLWLIAIASASPIILSHPLQGAGLIAVIGLLVLYRPSLKSLETAIGLIFSNVLVLEILVGFLHLDRILDRRMMLPSLVGLDMAIPTLLIALVANGGIVRYASRYMHQTANEAWQGGLSVLTFLCLLVCCVTPMSTLGIVLYLVSVASIVVSELHRAVRLQMQVFTWCALIVMTIAIATIIIQGWFILPLASATLTIALLGVMLHAVGTKLALNPTYRVIGWPILMYSHLPVATLGLLGVLLFCVTSGSMLTSFTVFGLFVVSAYYAFIGFRTESRISTTMALAYGNVGIGLLFRNLGWNDLQLYCVPLGLTFMAVAELVKHQTTRVIQGNLRMIGVLVILVSPLFPILQGHWLPMFTLMLLSLLVLCISIGARLRVPMFVSLAFLCADLVAILVRSTIDHPVLLWTSGLVVGISVMAFAALCEVHRERILGRIRLLSAELATWN